MRINGFLSSYALKTRNFEKKKTPQSNERRMAEGRLNPADIGNKRIVVLFFVDQ